MATALLAVVAVFSSVHCRDHVADETDPFTRLDAEVAVDTHTTVPDAPSDAGHDAAPDRACVTVTDALVVVARVADVQAPVAGWVSVRLEGGESFRVDVSDARGELRAQMLEFAQTNQQAVYVEVEPASATLRELLIPYASEVMDLWEEADGVDVVLMRSAAIHRLLAASPCYAPYLELLTKALASGDMILLTETRDSHEVIDVREVF